MFVHISNWKRKYPHYSLLYIFLKKTEEKTSYKFKQVWALRKCRTKPLIFVFLNCTDYRVKIHVCIVSPFYLYNQWNLSTCGLHTLCTHSADNPKEFDVFDQNDVSTFSCQVSACTARMDVIGWISTRRLCFKVLQASKVSFFWIYYLIYDD